MITKIIRKFARCPFSVLQLSLKAAGDGLANGEIVEQYPESGLWVLFNEAGKTAAWSFYLEQKEDALALLSEEEGEVLLQHLSEQS